MPLLPPDQRNGLSPKQFSDSRFITQLCAISPRTLTSTQTTDNIFCAKDSTSMLEVIEKLLILQDRDRKILKIKDHLAHIPHERQELQGKLAYAQSQLDAARLRVKQIESDRKKLELEVDSKKQQ